MSMRKSKLLMPIARSWKWKKNGVFCRWDNSVMDQNSTQSTLYPTGTFSRCFILPDASENCLTVIIHMQCYYVTVLWKMGLCAEKKWASLKDSLAISLCIFVSGQEKFNTEHKIKTFGKHNTEYQEMLALFSFFLSLISSVSNTAIKIWFFF